MLETQARLTDPGTVTTNLPSVIDGMKVLRPLGEGGFGAVYAVEAPGYDQTLALKVMSEEHVADDSLLLRFKREAEVIESIRSKHVIDIHAMGELDDGRLYILMEMLQGRTLASAIDEGPIVWERVVELGLQLCDALEAAHAQGVLHRDLKPDNIFLVPDGDRESIKILDFGIATFIPGHTDRFGSLTHTNALIGTPYYMSPEQVRSVRVGPTADLYMLAVVMYEMLTGVRPFGGGNLGMLLSAIVTGDYVPIRTLMPSCPGALERVVSQGMMVAAEHRFESASLMRRALEEVGDPHEPSTSETLRPSAHALPLAKKKGTPSTHPTLVGNPMGRAEPSGQHPQPGKKKTIPARISATPHVDESQHTGADDAVLLPVRNRIPLLLMALVLFLVVAGVGLTRLSTDRLDAQTPPGPAAQPETPSLPHQETGDTTMAPVTMAPEPTPETEPTLEHGLAPPEPEPETMQVTHGNMSRRPPSMAERPETQEPEAEIEPEIERPETEIEPETDVEPAGGSTLELQVETWSPDLINPYAD